MAAKEQQTGTRTRILVILVIINLPELHIHSTYMQFNAMQCNANVIYKGGEKLWFLCFNFKRKKTNKQTDRGTSKTKCFKILNDIFKGYRLQYNARVIVSMIVPKEEKKQAPIHT